MPVSITNCVTHKTGLPNYCILLAGCRRLLYCMSGDIKRLAQVNALQLGGSLSRTPRLLHLRWTFLANQLTGSIACEPA